MSPEHRALYARLATYSFDTPGAPMPYSRRLAEREGWSAPFTEAVIAEYKRFAFLAVTSEHMAAPSKAIDAAWHLHLEYTREYWDVFCADVLHKKLHHTPGTGAPEEAAFYSRCYEHTIERYTAVFGDEPPASIWPRKKDDAGQERAPNEAQEPEPYREKRTLIGRLRAMFSTWPAWLTAAVATGASASEVDVFNYAGPRFLVFYLLLCVTTLLTIRFLQKIEFNRRPQGARRGSEPPPSMTVDEVAYVTGGPLRMAQVATLWLMHAGAIELTPGTGSTRGHTYVIAKDPTKADRFEKEIAWLAQDRKGRARFETFRAHLMRRAPALSKQLAAHGWLWSAGGMSWLRYLSRVLALAVVGVGVAKVVIGLSRDRPVSILVFAIIWFVVFYLRLSTRSPGLGKEDLTASGREALAASRDRFARSGESQDDILWSAAFIGLGALDGSAWAAYMPALAVPPRIIRAGSGGAASNASSSCSSSSTDSSSSSSSCSSSSSSSCGSSGCGGCSSN
jgi:uncharacterized protein (TIGR04222 family)